MVNPHLFCSGIISPWRQSAPFKISFVAFQLQSMLQSLKKKCWDDLMAVLEFGPLSPLLNVDRSHVVNLLPCWTSQHCLVGVGKGYELKKGSSYMHIIVSKTRPKISASCEENNDQNWPSVPTNLFNDCRYKSKITKCNGFLNAHFL